VSENHEIMSFKVLLSSCLWATQIASYKLPKVQKNAARYRAAFPQNIQARKGDLACDSVLWVYGVKCSCPVCPMRMQSRMLPPPSGTLNLSTSRVVGYVSQWFSGLTIEPLLNVIASSRLFVKIVSSLLGKWYLS